MPNEKQFAKGLFLYPPGPKTPDFIKCKIVVYRDDLIAWLQQQKNEKISLDVMQSQQSKSWYASVNSWKPQRREDESKAPTAQTEQESDNDLAESAPI